MTEQELMILENMMNRIEQCEKTNAMLMDSVKQLVKSVNVLDETIRVNEQCFKDFATNNVYEILDNRIQREELFFPIVKSVEDTIHEIVDNRKSMSRFGDGEFSCIDGTLRCKYNATFYADLADRLKEVLVSDLDNHIVAIADNYGNVEKYTDQARREIRNYMTPKTRKMHYELLRHDKTYYNAYVSRFYVIYQEDDEATRKRFADLKRIWDKRDLIIVEGQYTKMGAGNDLFDNAASVKRVLAPAVDAYGRYDEILDAAMREGNDDSLYLIALGAAACVMAYDIAKLGRQALDIGQVDVEYEWYKMGTTLRVPIKGKYVNEAIGGENVEEVYDAKYESEIAARIY